MQPLPFDKRVPGQRVKWSYTRDDGTVIWYTGVIVPLPDGHPLKEAAEATHELIYVLPDFDLYPWLNRTEQAWWDFMITDNFGGDSPLYAEDEKE